MSSEYLVEVEHLKQYFPIRTGFASTTPLKAVDDISFVIYKGETLGIVGESGCGKTTSGKTCIGMLQPTSGQVKYQGKDVHHMTKKERFDFTGKVQMIFQDPYASLDPHQKVYDIVAEGIRIHKLASSREQEEKMVLELLDMVGLNAEESMNFPAASASASASPEPWRSTPSFCSATSRSLRWTSRFRHRSSTCSSSCRKNAI